MIEIKEIPKEYHFKDGEVVEVKGDLKSGIGRIIDSFYPTEQPKGELSYTYKYGEPFPQLGVEFEDGTKIHYNADDLLAGKIKSTDEIFNTPRKLIDFLKEKKVDMSDAYYSLGDPPQTEEELPLLKHLSNNNKIMKFVEPLFQEEVFNDSPETIFLGEFDSYVYIFRSVREGFMMRNSGVPAFVLSICVDGYAPVTIDLSTSEVY